MPNERGESTPPESIERPEARKSTVEQPLKAEEAVRQLAHEKGLLGLIVRAHRNRVSAGYKDVADVSDQEYVNFLLHLWETPEIYQPVLERIAELLEHHESLVASLVTAGDAGRVEELQSIQHQQAILRGLLTEEPRDTFPLANSPSGSHESTQVSPTAPEHPEPTPERSSEGGMLLLPPGVEPILFIGEADGVWIEKEPVERNRMAEELLAEHGWEALFQPGRVDPAWFRTLPYNARYLNGHARDGQDVPPVMFFVTDEPSSATYIVHDVAGAPARALLDYGLQTKQELQALGSGKVTRIFWFRDEALWKSQMEHALLLTKDELVERETRGVGAFDTASAIVRALAGYGVQTSKQVIVNVAKGFLEIAGIPFDQTIAGLGTILRAQPWVGERLTQLFLDISPPSPAWKQPGAVLQKLRAEGWPVDHDTLVREARALTKQEGATPTFAIRRFKGHMGRGDGGPFQTTDFFSPELIVAVEDVIRSEAPPPGWKTTDTLAHQIGGIGEPVVRKILNDLYAKRATLCPNGEQWAVGLFRSTGKGRSSFASPDLIRAIIAAVEGHKTTPEYRRWLAGWDTRRDKKKSP